MPAIRKAVAEWRSGKYKGATETTQDAVQLLVRRPTIGCPAGGSFAYYPAQREAIETLVWLYEVEHIRRHRDLVERFANVPGIHVLQYDDFARYAIKMATGSGKTKVMALAIAWQYFNAVAEGPRRLRQDLPCLSLRTSSCSSGCASDFAGGRIFRTDPIIPPELAHLLGDGLLHAGRH